MNKHGPGSVPLRVYGLPCSLGAVFPKGHSTQTPTELCSDRCRRFARRTLEALKVPAALQLSATFRFRWLTPTSRIWLRNVSNRAYHRTPLQVQFLLKRTFGRYGDMNTAGSGFFALRPPSRRYTRSRTYAFAE